MKMNRFPAANERKTVPGPALRSRCMIIVIPHFSGMPSTNVPTSAWSIVQPMVFDDHAAKVHQLATRIEAPLLANSSVSCFPMS